MSGGLGIPRVDFSPLSKLGEDLALGLNRSERRNAVQGIGLAPGDPQFLPKLGQTLVGLGDIDGALAVSRLQEASQDRAFQRQISERDFDFRKTESGRAQANADRSFGAQQEGSKYDRLYQDRTAARADQSLDIQRQAALRREYPAGYEADPNLQGGQRPIPGGPMDPGTIERAKAAENAAKAKTSVNPYATGDQTFNADQGKSAGFADRMFQNEGLIQSREELGTSRVQQGLAKAPFGIGSYANSDDFKSYKAAKENWIAAQLRKESGAAIGQGEYDAADRQYFPQPGDPAPVLEQKRQLRRLATEGMAREGGGSYQPKFTFGEGNRVQPYTPQPRGESAPAQAGGARTVPHNQVPEGARFRRDGKIYRRVNGQDVPE